MQKIVRKNVFFEKWKLNSGIFELRADSRVRCKFASHLLQIVNFDAFIVDASNYHLEEDSRKQWTQPDAGVDY